MAAEHLRQRHQTKKPSPLGGGFSNRLNKLKIKQMKHLMELPSWNIAVITWWEDVDFPVKEKNRYNLLLRSRTHYPEHMTPNEDKELQELAGVQGERTIRIGKIEIVNMLPVDCNTIPTSFSLSGADFLALQKEIEKLKEPYIGQFITLGDNWCAEVEY